MSNQGPESQTILVVGGGIAGITVAVEAAECGYDVILLERGPALGGRVARFSRYFPKLCHPTRGLDGNKGAALNQNTIRSKKLEALAK